MKKRLKFNKNQLKIFGIIILVLALPLTLILVNKPKTTLLCCSPNKLEIESGTLSSSGVTKQRDSGASGGNKLLLLINKILTPTPTPSQVMGS